MKEVTIFCTQRLPGHRCPKLLKEDPPQCGLAAGKCDNQEMETKEQEEHR